MKWRYDEHFNLLREDYTVRGHKLTRWFICWAENGEKVPNSCHDHETGPMMWAEENQDKLWEFLQNRIDSIILTDTP